MIGSHDDWKELEKIQDLAIGWKETLEGYRMGEKNPEEYERWLNARVGTHGTMEEREKRYKQQFCGIWPEQGFYAYKKTAIRDIEKYLGTPTLDYYSWFDGGS